MVHRYIPVVFCLLLAYICPVEVFAMSEKEMNDYIRQLLAFAQRAESAAPVSPAPPEPLVQPESLAQPCPEKAAAEPVCKSQPEAALPREDSSSSEQDAHAEPDEQEETEDTKPLALEAIGLLQLSVRNELDFAPIEGAQITISRGVELQVRALTDSCGISPIIALIASDANDALPCFVYDSGEPYIISIAAPGFYGVSATPVTIRACERLLLPALLTPRF